MSTVQHAASTAVNIFSTIHFHGPASSSNGRKYPFNISFLLACYSPRTIVIIHFTLHVDGPEYPTHDREQQFHIRNAKNIHSTFPFKRNVLRQTRPRSSISLSTSTARHTQCTTVNIHLQFQVYGPACDMHGREHLFHNSFSRPGICHARP